MTDNKNNNEISVLKKDLQQVIETFKESNEHAQRRNELAQKELHQSKLNYEQVERQYLIEKSRLQPIFRLSATEFLSCEPDFLNDPEQATEAKFLADAGIGVDERVLRISMEVTGEGVYMQPSLVIGKVSNDADEQAMSMTDKLYFITVEQAAIDESNNSLDVYLVYRDKTTLPVIHKYQLVKRSGSTLLRWDPMHMDTYYVSSHTHRNRLKKAEGCAEFFSNREGS